MEPAKRDSAGNVLEILNGEFVDSRCRRSVSSNRHGKHAHLAEAKDSRIGC